MLQVPRVTGYWPRSTGLSPRRRQTRQDESTRLRRSGRWTVSAPGEIACALGVEENGILGCGREHAAFFETDNVEMRTAGVAGLLQTADVEMPGTRTLGRDLQRLDALADEAKRLAERALEAPSARSSLT